MKLSKIISGIVILSVIMSPVQVWASGTISGIGLLASEEENKEINIYQVVLPTEDALGIVLDPQGLLSISEQGAYDSSWAGKIQMEENGGALFVNKSSFPVKVNVGISVGQDANGTSSTIDLLDDDTYVDDGAWPQMYLTVIPGTAKIQSMDDFVPSDTNIPILANGSQELTKFSFLLDSSDYIQDEETGEYILEDDEDNYDSASFILGGRVNKNADWSAFTGANKERLIIHAVYTIQKQDSYDEQRLYQADEDENGPHALMKE